jgi:hypothetical protein
MRNLFRKPDLAISLLGLAFGVIFGVFTVLDYLKIDPALLRPVLPYAIPVSAVGLIVFFALATLFFFRNLRRVRNVFTTSHQVSHKLRDALHISIQKICGSGTDQSDTNEFRAGMNEEKGTLNEVCTWIADLLKELTQAECATCISLLCDPLDSKEPECFLWAHSNNYIPVSKSGMLKFRVRRNTRFEEVYFAASDGKNTTHYFSADISKESHYRCELNGLDSYFSTIILPLQCVKDPREFLGFLKVETKETNRLNGNWHVEILASYADQIYLFLDARRAIGPKGKAAPDRSPAGAS